MSGFLPIKISLLAFGGRAAVLVLVLVLVLVDNGADYSAWWHIMFIDK
jgi:uncharacterized membrane protein